MSEQRQTRAAQADGAWHPGHALGRVLRAGVWASMATLAAGLTLALGSGQRGGHGMRPDALLHDLAHGRGTGILGLGLALLLLTPVAREVTAAIAFALHGERAYTIIGVVVLALVAVSLALGGR